MKHINQISRISLRDQVYQRLRMAIINLELKPGQRINDKSLAEQFGVSRTPVREALKRLEDEGLIESSPGAVTKVTLVDEQEAKHAFTVVAALHSLAAKLAIPYLENTHANEMEKINREFKHAIEQKDAIKAVDEDTKFHRVLLKAAHNPEIEVALERIMPKIRRLELLKFGSVDGASSVEVHRQIIQVIRQQDKKNLPILIEENWLSLSQLLTNPS
ncbi:GntR family transcriptional regulator [Aneurinibacillus aneurinilyticus]|uniref:GntR family transcriptional regulator n=1 Tax=Aneurinibacillus aneurinilyticus TaxID=1391 RepID=A0A848D135_ANEAE|nr:GntR family transcriptional regulator [Aneurinibacillus aneurinilyticus]MED0669601.1 GntR family transcriptional regulator [Aneurinibacillus aneurinilyticus]NME99320.1 GntR family transcriptional regulator [Aneurinibacillus aneurinilyticus]